MPITEAKWCAVTQAEWRAAGMPQPPRGHRWGAPWIDIGGGSRAWYMLVRQKEFLLKRKVQKIKEKEINKEFTDIFFGNHKTYVDWLNERGPKRDMTVDEVVNQLWNVIHHNPKHSWRDTLCQIVRPMIEYDKETMKYQSTNPHIKLFGEVIKKYFDRQVNFITLSIATQEL